MDVSNLFGQAVQSKLGIVGLLFVVVAGISRAFFGSETPLRIRLIVFGSVFAGFSLFAVAVLLIETPAAANLDFGVEMTNAKAREIREEMANLDATGENVLSQLIGGIPGSDLNKSLCESFDQRVENFAGRYKSTVPSLSRYIEKKMEQARRCR